VIENYSGLPVKALIIYIVSSSHIISHVAEIGLLRDGKHLRNVNHDNIDAIWDIISLCIDESLLFIDVIYLAKCVYAGVNHRPKLQHILLYFDAVNTNNLCVLKIPKSFNV
jgi:hypothetical protein